MSPHRSASSLTAAAIALVWASGAAATTSSVNHAAAAERSVWQPTDRGNAARSPAVEPLDITGREFAGQRLPLEATPGRVGFSANRATVWSEPSRLAPGTPPTQRILLEGDVRIRLGLYQFEAARAVVWLQSLASEEPGAKQVFVYFDRVATRGADPAIAVSGDRLPVQGVLRPDGPVRLTTDVQRQGRPDDSFLLEAEGAFAGYLRQLVGFPAPPPDALPEVRVPRPRPGDPPTRPGLDRPYDVDPLLPETEDLRTVATDRLPGVPRAEPIFAQDGVLSFVSGDITLVRGEEENALLVTDGVIVQYEDRTRDQRVQLTAERAVVFLEPGPLADLGRFEVEDVRGIYLEGGVHVTDGEYSLRGPRVYYDVRRDRALVLDAVFWTYDELRRMPIYLRADAIRQESARQFSASRATLANTAFATPHLSIGASSVTLTRRTDEQGRSSTHADARNITMRAGDVPFFYWPFFRGDPERIPLRDVRVENTGSGTGVKTTWDALSLFGIDPPEGLRSDLIIDGYFTRGPAFGTQTSWEGPDGAGRIDGYILPDDRGIDRMQTGARINREGEVRGMILGEHRQRLGEQWTIFAEGSYISDEAFVDSFFRPLGRERREFVTGANLRRLDDHSLLSLEARGTFNDFIANDYLLSSQGYTTEKLPEVSYRRVADDLLAETAPGLLTYFSEVSASRMSLMLNQPEAREQGFDTTSRAQRAFGIAPDQSLAEVLLDQGFSESTVNRFDTRHEITANFNLGPVIVSPFAVGRFTAYDDRFEGFSPEEEDRSRLWGGGGLRLSTSIQRVDDSVDSKLLDLHRIRHIIEPSVTVWHAGTTLDSADLPVYDDDVEALTDGSAVRFAIDQTWQTQRGGPGRWRSVDVLTISGEAVFHSADADRTSPIGRFYDSRPEQSNPGEYLSLDGVWRVSEVFALAGNTTYDLEINQQSRSVFGYIIDHTPDFSTSADLRYVNSQDVTFLNFAARYRMGEKYLLGGNTAYNLESGDFNRVSLDLQREFPNAFLGVNLNYNNITGDTTFGFVLTPGGGLPAGLRVQDVRGPGLGR